MTSKTTDRPAPVSIPAHIIPPRGILPVAGPRSRVMNAARPGPLTTPANRRGLTSVAGPQAFARWNPGVKAASEVGDAVITIYDVIGESWDGSGVTVNRIDAALRKIGNRPVEAHINSPGGDVFEGIACFNRLQQHPAKVTIKVMGLAASAASIIAMAGDEVQIAPSAFLMIHNCWVVAAGDRNDMRSVADYLEPFDDALAGVYAARTGTDKAKIAKMLDAETWMNGTQAVEGKFADSVLTASDLVEDETIAANASARRNASAAFAAMRASGLSVEDARAQVTALQGSGPNPAPAEQADHSWFGAAASLAQALRA